MKNGRGLQAVKYSTIIAVLYSVFLIFWIINDYNESMNKFIKYGIFYAELALLFILALRKDLFIGPKTLFRRFMYFALFVVLIAVCFQLVHQENNPYFIVRFLQLISPFLFAYLAFTVAGSSAVYAIVDVSFLALGIGYTVHVIQNFSIANLLAFNFNASTSAFEGINYADQFMILFIYYRFLDDRKVFWKWVTAFVYCFFCFKRMHIVLMFVFLFLGSRINEIKISERVRNRIMVFITVIYLAIPYFFQYYYTSVVTTLQTNDDPITLIMQGRNIFIKMFVNSDFYPLGLGWCDHYTDAITGGWVTGLHNDILVLFYDTSIIGLLLFLCIIFDMLRQNSKMVMIIAFLLLDMLVNPILFNATTWVLVYCAYYGSVDSEHIAGVDIKPIERG